MGTFLKSFDTPEHAHVGDQPHDHVAENNSGQSEPDKLQSRV